MSYIHVHVAFLATACGDTNTNAEHTTQALSKKGKRIEDPQIVAWANSKVEGCRIRSFGDPSLSTGVFLLQVCMRVCACVRVTVCIR